MAVTALLVGCSGDKTTELPPEKDKELRNSFDRALTPEEVAMMGQSKGAEAPAKK
ncbi:MAG TPA: hypothetical protein VGE01_11850 [Fimbriimonas sp.]